MPYKQNKQPLVFNVIITGKKKRTCTGNVHGNSYRTNDAPISLPSPGTTQMVQFRRFAHPPRAPDHRPDIAGGGGQTVKPFYFKG